jgi:segregation and condensation protein A
MTDVLYNAQYPTSSEYEVHTPAFEGPLALLLHLIEKNELDITKIALARVTDEFLARVDEMRAAMQIEVVADFLAVAARLLWIKSKTLLPKPPASAQEVLEEDVGDELVRQLRAYRRFKEAAQWLRERDDAGLRGYVHTGRPPRPQHVTLDLSGVTLEELRRRAQDALYPQEAPPPQEAIQRPRISIGQQIHLIRRRLTHLARVTYRRLLSSTPTRVEAVVTLQAILELIKQRAVRASQEHRFGDIVIEPCIPPEDIPDPTEPTS